MINDIRVAFAFLTRIPIGHKPDISIQRSAMWFPLVGSVLGLSSGLVFLGLNQIIPALPAAVITILFSVLVVLSLPQFILLNLFPSFSFVIFYFSNFSASISSNMLSPLSSSSPTCATYFTIRFMNTIQQYYIKRIVYGFREFRALHLIDIQYEFKLDTNRDKYTPII